MGTLVLSRAVFMILVHWEHSMHTATVQSEGICCAVRDASLAMLLYWHSNRTPSQSRFAVSKHNHTCKHMIFQWIWQVR
jgi:hypothetical protein